jgi:hypothetical protein
VFGLPYEASAFGVRRSAFGVRRSAFGVRRSAFGVRRSANYGNGPQLQAYFQFFS